MPLTQFPQIIAKFNLKYFRISFAKMGRENDNNEKHNSHSSQSSPKSTGPSSPAPSISCETCAQLSQLEIEAFAAVKEVAPYVRSINVSEMLTRTSELLFLNVVTLENESYCIELTKKGWRICSDRLDCMNGDFRKLEMHVQYYETIQALLDKLSKLYRDKFSEALAQRLDELQQKEGTIQMNGSNCDDEPAETRDRSSSCHSADERNRSRHQSSNENCVVATVIHQHRRQPCAEFPIPTPTSKMFKQTSASQQSTNPLGESINAAINGYLDERTQRNNPEIQRQINLATILLEQQQQRPSSAHSSPSLLPQMQPLSSRKLFIGGLGQINDDGLRQYYSQWGQVVDCIVIRDPVTRSSRGFGFVTYATAEMADNAIANRPHIISGKAVDAKRAVPREKMNLIVENDQPPIFLSVDTSPGCRLQMSGLNWEWHTLDTLRTHFEQFGPVEQLEMVAYPRGYGSLSFENLDAVEKCMAIGPVHNVNGHPVEIKIASADSLVFHPKDKDQQFAQSRPNSSSGSTGANSRQTQNENSESPPIRPDSSDGSSLAA